ncbi:MAG: Nucleotidyltransferase domain protein [Candidatus Methanolliviera sp. GoM_oil]|nr:MAG: Nucleotidyltransferase domain protein [Candidatus Methanolliviera sp. GoM_oil]
MLKISSSSLKEKLNDYPFVDQLMDVIEKIKKYDPVAIVLFGSLAAGDFLNDSDADIVVIFGDERVDFLETISELKKLDDTGYIDLFPYGWKQFSDMLRDFNLLALDAFARGYAIHIGDETIWKRILDVGAGVMRDVEPIENGWKVKVVENL